MAAHDKSNPETGSGVKALYLIVKPALLMSVAVMSKP